MAKKHDDAKSGDVEEVNLDEIELPEDILLDDPLIDIPAEAHFEEFIEKASQSGKIDLAEDELRPKKGVVKDFEDFDEMNLLPFLWTKILT